MEQGARRRRSSHQVRALEPRTPGSGRSAPPEARSGTSGLEPPTREHKPPRAPRGFTAEATEGRRKSSICQESLHDGVQGSQVSPPFLNFSEKNVALEGDPGWYRDLAVPTSSRQWAFSQRPDTPVMWLQTQHFTLCP